MPINQRCGICGWEGPREASSTPPHACPGCGNSGAMQSAALARGNPQQAVVVLDRPRPQPIEVEAMHAAFELIQRAGYALVPAESHAALAQRHVDVVPPVANKEYAVVISAAGQVTCSGAGIGGGNVVPGRDNVAAVLNECGKHGYRVVTTVVTNGQGVWTLERDSRDERVLRSRPDPVVSTPSTGASAAAVQAAAGVEQAAVQAGVPIVTRGRP